MNQPSNMETNDPLSRVLREWTVDSALPPRFQERVWQRVARAESPPRLGLLAALSSLAQYFTRPTVAAGYLAALLAIGVIGGLWTAQLERDRVDHDLSERYVHALDPYIVAASTR